MSIYGQVNVVKPLYNYIYQENSLIKKIKSFNITRLEYREYL